VLYDAELSYVVSHCINSQINKHSQRLERMPVDSSDSEWNSVLQIIRAGGYLTIRRSDSESPRSDKQPEVNDVQGPCETVEMGLCGIPSILLHYPSIAWRRWHVERH
jgi:hypothetical protein